MRAVPTLKRVASYLCVTLATMCMGRGLDDVASDQVGYCRDLSLESQARVQCWEVGGWGLSSQGVQLASLRREATRNIQ